MAGVTPVVRVERRGPLACFVLLEPLTVRELTIDPPFASDGESVPFWAQWLFPRASAALPASIAHDYRLSLTRDPAARFRAHREFREDLIATGVRTWRAQIMWRAAMLADDTIPVARRLRFLFTE
jgi:hypothetical protein